LARLRAVDRPRLALFRLPFFAELRALFRADLFVPRRAAFRAPFLADFLPALARLADFRALRRLALFLGVAVRAGAGSVKSSKDEVLEVGVVGGVFSIGRGSIQPEPDQPISI
jgi:hypothetical protein